MKIIYLAFLIANVITSSGYVFYDIPYNREYVLDIEKFYPYNYIPANMGYYFRANVEQDEKMQIEIKVLKNAIINFKMDVCGYYTFPSDMQALNGHDLCKIGLQGKKVNSDINYDIYLYDFETIKFAEYLIIHIENYHSLYYLSINLSKK